jgi:hypothetical protein
MLVVETVARIRREFFVKGKSIKEIVRSLGVSRNTVRKVLRSGETAFAYERTEQPLPKLGPWASGLDGLLAANAGKARRERLLPPCGRCLRPTPRLRFKTLDELNAWLADRCVAHARRAAHPELKDRTVWDVFEAADRPALIGYRGPFDGFHALPASVSKTLLVRFDYNKYSVHAKAAGRSVDIHAYADRIVIRQGGEIVGEHTRRFGRDQVIYDPWHDLPVLKRKPGALRNGAPFKDWALPPAIERVRRRLAGHADGDRQMVGILTAITSDGVDAVEAACAEALVGGPVSCDVVLNILTRQRQPPAPLNIVTPDALRLRHEPRADCARYDSLRRPYGTPPDPGDDGRTEARRHASRL